VTATTRALHLIDPVRAGWPACDALRTLLDCPGGEVEHEVVLVGAAPDMLMADRLGLRWSRRVPAPPRAAGAFANRTESLWSGHAAPDVLCTWSESTLLLGHGAGRRMKRLGVLIDPPAGIAKAPIRRRLLRGALGRTDRLVFSTRFARSAWLALGLPPGSTSVAPIPIDLGRLEPGARTRLREEWCVEDKTGVILAVAEPGSAVQAQRCVYHAGIATLAGARNALVLPPDADQLDRALRFTERHSGWWRLIVDDRPVWELLEACDAALWFGPPALPDGHSLRGPVPGGTGMAWAAASGCPVVAESHESILESLADGPRVHLCRSGNRIEVCSAILEALDPVNRGQGSVRSSDPVLAARHDPDAFARRITGEILAACGRGTAPSVEPGAVIGEAKVRVSGGRASIRATAPAGAPR